MLGEVNYCNPVFDFAGEFALQSLTAYIQFNGVTLEFDILTDNNGIAELGKELLPNVMFYMALFNSIGEKIGCYKFQTTIIKNAN